MLSRYLRFKFRFKLGLGLGLRFGIDEVSRFWVSVPLLVIRPDLSTGGWGLGHRYPYLVILPAHFGFYSVVSRRFTKVFLFQGMAPR